MQTSKEIERVQAFWNARPCNIRHSAAPFGTKEYFDQVEQRKYFVEPHIPAFAEHQLWADKKVLEIGCGIGTDATNFARAGANYHGLELSEESLDVTKKRFEVFDQKGSFYLGNAEHVAEVVPERDFDLIYSFGVIHHTPNPRAVIESSRKMIKPTGELRIMLYARESWKSYMIDIGLDQPEAQSGCPYAFVYTVDEVKELLKGCYEVTETYQDHIFPYQVEEYVKYNYVMEPWFAAMPPAMFRSLERRLGWHMMIKARPE